MIDIAEPNVFPDSQNFPLSQHILSETLTHVSDEESSHINQGMFTHKHWGMFTYNLALCPWESFKLEKKKADFFFNL